MNINNAVKVLDLEGLLCPIPVVKISNAMKEISVGESITATATDPGVMMDIPAWCASTGNELERMDESDGIFTFQVKRLK
jgi:tRNA 2-thiouridine synthesizing protein A